MLGWKDLAKIEALYLKVDVALSIGKTEANALEVERIEAEQVLNDQAYFVLCWGQIETAIDERCRDAIRRRRTHADWQVRRGWDLYNPDDPRLSGLSFESRASLVLDRSEGRGRPFAIAIRHYEARNRIAHGRLVQARIDVVAVIRDFYGIQAALHRAT